VGEIEERDCRARRESKMMRNEPEEVIFDKLNCIKNSYLFSVKDKMNDEREKELEHDRTGSKAAPITPSDLEPCAKVSNVSEKCR